MNALGFHFFPITKQFQNKKDKTPHKFIFSIKYQNNFKIKPNNLSE